jgi:hypothetical protein
VEALRRVHTATLMRRVAALEASMSENTRPPDNGQSAPPPENRLRHDEALLWLAERGEDTSLDALIGEIVRFLVRADKAAFAKIYAVVKTEADRMDARSNEQLRALWTSRKKKSSPPPPPETTDIP